MTTTQETILHPTYLPFSEDQLKAHFASVRQNGKPVKTGDAHIETFKRSINAYETYLAKNPSRIRASISEMRRPCQIEKDETFWTASCLMTLYYSNDRVKELSFLFTKAYGASPPIFGLDRWEDCFSGELYLFFETNLPSPRSYKQWLRQNLRNRQFISYILESDNGTKNLEGPTNVDALVLNAENGFAVIIEAKVLSDISCQITYDVMRNQIARNIDVMLEKNPSLCPPLKNRDPEKTLFLLLTPRLFKEIPASRFYGFKLNDYKSHPETIGLDLPHRKDYDWKKISQRLGWLTWEDCREVNRKCCPWLV